MNTMSSKPPSHALSGVGKIQPIHLDRLAVVYVRQSTLQQIERHQESTRLQYGLVDRALALGWAKQRVEVIDDDLGRSGATAQGRPGFQRLVAEVGLDHVGIVLGIEMSRLARLSRDRCATQACRSSGHRAHHGPHGSVGSVTQGPVAGLHQLDAI